MTRLPLPERLGALFVCPADGSEQMQHETVHALLNECIPIYAGERKITLPEKLAIVRSEMGKPCFPDVPEIQFNLSHCKGLAACLLSPFVCGVDVEMRRPLREKVVRRVFSAEEQAALLADDDPDLLFTQLWTLKEAYVKAIGIGISFPMREVCFSVTDEGISSNRKDAVFRQFVEREFIISVCLLGVS